MPYFYHIDRTVDVIFVRHIGRVSSADLCAQLEEILLHADFTSGLNMFFDHRDEVPPEFNVDKDTIPPGERDIYRSRLRSLFGSFKQSKMACLVNENLLEFFDGMIETMKNIPEINSEVFTDIESAKEWLELDVNYDVSKRLKDTIVPSHS